MRRRGYDPALVRKNGEGPRDREGRVRAVYGVEVSPLDAAGRPSCASAKRRSGGSTSSTSTARACARADRERRGRGRHGARASRPSSGRRASARTPTSTACRRRCRSRRSGLTTRSTRTARCAVPRRARGARARVHRAPRRGRRAMSASARREAKLIDCQDEKAALLQRLEVLETFERRHQAENAAKRTSCARRPPTGRSSSRDTTTRRTTRCGTAGASCAAATTGSFEGDRVRVRARRQAPRRHRPEAPRAPAAIVKASRCALRRRRGARAPPAHTRCASSSSRLHNQSATPPELLKLPLRPMSCGASFCSSDPEARVARSRWVMRSVRRSVPAALPKLPRPGGFQRR